MMAFAYFPVLISVGYKFLKGSFASESQLNHPKMCENQKYVSPLVQSTDYTLPKESGADPCVFIRGDKKYPF